mgnify:FL=1
MTDIERTELANEDFKAKTLMEVFAEMEALGDDEPLACGVEDPDVCESCT